MRPVSALPRPVWSPRLGAAERRAALLALVLSLMVHLVAVLLAPGSRPDSPAETRSLQVTLLSPPPQAPPVQQPTVLPPSKTPKPQAIAQPAPTSPRPPRPAVVSQPKSGTQAVKVAAAPALPAPSVAEAAPATVSTVPVASEVPAPVAQPAVTPAVATVPDSAQLARYGNTLSDLLARQQQYPRIAAARGWEGDVVLVLVIARKGSLVAARVARSSGHSVLDQHALALVADVQPFPAMPGTVAGDELEVTVPIRYHLNKNG